MYFVAAVTLPVCDCGPALTIAPACGCVRSGLHVANKPFHALLPYRVCLTCSGTVSCRTWSCCWEHDHFCRCPAVRRPDGPAVGICVPDLLGVPSCWACWRIAARTYLLLVLSRRTGLPEPGARCVPASAVLLLFLLFRRVGTVPFSPRGALRVGRRDQYRPTRNRF